MKRSYDYSFVQDSNNTSTTPHSFRRRTATLAAHPFYGREDYMLSAGPSYHYQDPQLAPYLLNTYQAFDSDFQSNIWHPSLLTIPSNWNNNELRLPAPERRLTGLGITFDASEAPPNTSRPLLTTPSYSQSINEQDMEQGGSVAQTSETDRLASAYSECPGVDFTAHSPSTQSVDCVPLSPADEFLMLVDLSPLSDNKMDMDCVSVDSPSCSELPSLSSAFDTPGEGHVGIIPDVNFNTLAAQQGSPIACVNPRDITGPGPIFVQPKDEEEDVAMIIEDAALQYPESPLLASDCKADFPADAVSAIVSVLAASAENQSSPTKRMSAISVPRQRQYACHPLTSVQLPAFASRSVGRPPSSLASVTYSTVPIHRSPLAPIQPLEQIPQPLMPVNQLSPVLNAHEGVPLEDLRRRADAFRGLNPGFDLDKTFLQAYAGRLSERGELIADFRCYVKDCTQSNKRRDHILVHVGSHVEHRPFKCDQCGMRFLRKNECKRHMSSHAGFKPYSCTVCPPFLEKNFVRQDLLKRHMKVAHGAPSTSRKRKGESFSPTFEYHE